MSKRRLDESGFWKPKVSSISSISSHHHNTSSLIKESNNNLNEESTPYIFNIRNSSSSSIYIQKQSLPIYKHKRQILYAIEHYSIIIIVGETGSGKSTQLPQYLFENGWCQHGHSIVCTQPRRIAAQTISQRVASEIGCKLGQIVGYKVRFDDVTTPSVTCIKYVTDGTLLREATLDDPLLSKYSVIMIDEAHERNVNTDVLLGIVKKIRRKRKDLRVVICSATIDAEKFLDFFIPQDVREEVDVEKETQVKANLNANNMKRKRRRWGKVGEDHPGDIDNSTDENNLNQNSESKIMNRGTIISIDGRQHPVDILHIKEPVADYIQSTVDTALRIHHDLTNDDGDILAFLPTGEDIDRAIHYANESVSSSSYSQKKQRLSKNIVFLPLYGNLPYHMQSKVFQPKLASDLTRRVIFATNIAETSVTVPHISSVIDCGFVKLPFYDTETGFDRLVIR